MGGSNEPSSGNRAVRRSLGLSLAHTPLLAFSSARAVSEAYHSNSLTTIGRRSAPVLRPVGERNESREQAIVKKRPAVNRS